MFRAKLNSEIREFLKRKEEKEGGRKEKREEEGGREKEKNGEKIRKDKSGELCAEAAAVSKAFAGFCILEEYNSQRIVPCMVESQVRDPT